jgi:para-aminobenzoate synthetase component 1
MNNNFTENSNSGSTYSAVDSPDSNSKAMKIISTELAYIESTDLFDKVSDQPWAMFLDSGRATIKSTSDGPADGVTPISKHANYDVIAIKPHATLVFNGTQTLFTNRTVEEPLLGDPLAILQSAIPSVENPENHEYVPGAIGYFSYDLARQFEDIPNLADDEESLPMMAMAIYYVVVVVNHKDKKTTLLQLGDSAEVQAVANEWRDLIEWCNDFDDEFGPVGDLEENEPDEAEQNSFGGLLSGLLKENMGRDIYRKRFKRIRDYTVDGDCYQVNLTKQFSVQVTGDGWPTYRYLRKNSPAPYGAYMNFPFAQVLSNSPESFIQCRNGEVTTSPIKGTRPRNLDNKAVDKANANALFNSPKDRAENVMIVDLMRNDLSRCCELGSVKTPRLFEVHSFANVHHLISTVRGTLRKSLHSLDLLRSCFPGGSITGAPKIRAMEIIEELEPTRRGLYCGAIGYVGVDGNLETNIAIRTIVVKDGVARYSAGGGLVIDSEVEAEYQELLDKSRMMTEALFKNKRPVSY